MLQQRDANVTIYKSVNTINWLRNYFCILDASCNSCLLAFWRKIVGGTRWFNARTYPTEPKARFNYECITNAGLLYRCRSMPPPAQIGNCDAIGPLRSIETTAMPRRSFLEPVTRASRSILCHQMSLMRDGADPNGDPTSRSPF